MSERLDPDHHLRGLADPGTDTVILVPGIDGTALLFYRQLPLLAQHFNVLSFPLPDNPDASMEDLVADLARLIGEVSDHGAILLGESFGGALSMSTALAHPELVRGLVVVNSFPYLDQRVQLRLAPLALKVMPWGLMPIVRRFTEAKLHSPHCLDEDLAEFHQRSRAIGQHGYRRRLEIIRGYDIRNRLSDIEAPTLFLAGDRDRLVPSVDWGRFMVDRVPNADLQILEGYGHVCLINHDLDVSEPVANWWSTRPSANHPGGDG
ncbi:MAG: alpha/beta hydrolase [Actinomycetia bacterium]|nr:alpha/beta hydrolase [Actinomycetes bacterium]